MIKMNLGSTRSWPLLLKKNSGYVHACTFHRKDNQSTNACVNIEWNISLPTPPPRSSSCLTTFTRVYHNTSVYMQHKVWISMNYILIPSFFPYQQRRGESFGQSRDVFCFGSRRNYQQIAFMVLWQKNKEYSLAYLKIPFSHENKEQICFICIEKYNEISNFWI